MLGETLGEAYQVADDLRDVLCDAEELGKPIGQDAARYRPNAAAQLGIGGAKARLEQLVRAAADSIPDSRARLSARSSKRRPRSSFPSSFNASRPEGAGAMAALSAGLSGATVVERIRDWRSRIIADARFQRWAANSPFTRRLAQRKARALFDLCAGFVYSQVLSACVKLEVFELLRAGPKDCEALAPRMALSVPAARRLLKAAASLRLLRALPNDRFALDDLGAAMIGNPAIAAFVAHHDLLYDDLRDPVALLRGEHETALSRFWPYAANRPGEA